LSRNNSFLSRSSYPPALKQQQITTKTVKKKLFVPFELPLKQQQITTKTLVTNLVDPLLPKTLQFCLGIAKKK
jgi:hypothetical protein